MIDPFASTAFFLSLRVALVATLCLLPIGVLLAWVLARGRFPGKSLLDGLVHLPLVLPPVVIGYLLLLGFGRNGPFGQTLAECCGIRLVFNWQAAALAAGVMALPLFVRALRLSFETLDQTQIEAAATLGAGPLKRLWTVILPALAPGLITGSLLAFARALGEFGATITLAANIPGETQTLPLALYAALQRPDGDATAVQLAVLSALLAIGALLLSDLAARWLAGRRAA